MATTNEGSEGAVRRGRPRSFDREAALRAATIEFWDRGYEAVSIADLTRVMGVKAPSLYAAFGDKKTLFEEAIEAYVREFGGFIDRALEEEPTARQGVARMLHEAATWHTLPGYPRGCMLISAAVNCTVQSAEVAQDLAERRREGVTALERRIAADVAAEILPPSTDVHGLAVYATTVLHGMAQQARDGADQETLETVARTAMLAWPQQDDGAAPEQGKMRAD